MQNEQEVKEIVKEKYGEIAKKSSIGCGCGCGPKNNKIIDYVIMKDEYTNLDGYVAEADLGLGCGLPTEHAAIKPGDVVVDLGSGAGNDVFVARAIVGDQGKVIGIDFTNEMIEKAESNKQKLGFNNIEFIFGDIESMPIEDSTADVVVSNCVLNLVPDKKKAFAEIYRILKPGGHFCVSDIVLKGELQANIKKSSEMYAGCVAGAVQQEEYLEIIRTAGFKSVEIKRTKAISIPENILQILLSKDELEIYRNNEIGIFSITVYADKVS